MHHFTNAFSVWSASISLKDTYMAALDVLILVVVFIGFLSGFMRGFVKEMASMIGLVAGLFVARALYTAVGVKLAAEVNCSVTVAQIIAFVLIWLFIPLILSLFASLLTRVIEAVHLGCLNRWLGSLVGCIKCVLIVGLVIHAIEFIDSKDELIAATKKNESLFYHPVREFTGIFFPVIKSVTINILD